MKIYKHVILYERGTVQKLALRFKVSDKTVTNALKFITEGEQPDMIREVALKEYGCVLKRRPANLESKVCSFNS